jgi:HEAT repeat protein
MYRLRGFIMGLREWLVRHRFSWGSFGFVLLLTLAGYVVVQPSQENIAHFFGQLYRDVAVGAIGLEDREGVPLYTKDLSVPDLQQMLESTNPSLKASAIKAIGERSDYNLLPNLIKILNDTEPLVDTGDAAGTSLASLARDSLTQMARNTINQQPGNINLLSPFFAKAVKGSALEREGMLQIMGAIEEPLAISLLFRIRDQETDSDIKMAAEEALARVTSDRIGTTSHRKLRANQLQIVLAMSALAAMLCVTGVNCFRHGMDATVVLFPIVPILLCGWLVCLVTVEFQRGRADFKAVAAAIAEIDPSALRALNYQDSAHYPGDSYIAQYLVAMGNADVIRALALLDLPDPDDLESWKNRVRTRNNWVLARILASNLDPATLGEWIQSSDPRIRLAVAKGLGALTIRHDAVLSALKLLTNDEDDRVRKTATELIPLVERYPRWDPCPE